MIKMLIADDEPKIRQGIAACRDWTAIGVEVAGMARNGRELITLCREMAPDICLVDICMPHMDGLDAMEVIREFLPEIRFIVISGYEEFNYARRAVCAGAEAYILKPIDEGELWDTVKQTVASLEADRANAGLLRFARRRLEAVKPLLFEQFIQEWLHGGFSQEELVEELGFWELDSEGRYTLVMVEHTASETLKGGDGVFREQLYALYHALESLLDNPAVQWAVLGPRISLGIFKGCIQEDSESFCCRAEEIVGGQVNLALKVFVQELDSPERCFVSVCEEMLKEAEQRRQISPIVVSVRRIIDAEYMDKELSLGSVACRMNISVSYLSRLFREDTGMGFSEYLIRTRVREAIRQMTLTDAKIGDIADQVGYRSIHYFSNAFKKITGMSPGEYRFGHEGVLP